ncbi:hypothetical protein CCACVL1_19778 [Corchorus capsularis]|uniref:Uncharacterized protein n=1 Tax=Corchorus capsularis TaxID=210143 RepID=A0A1R3HF53_COCAP|nr:hypothetical protein CCACVL1_19778 [Corchorus capsularis]
MASRFEIPEIGTETGNFRNADPWEHVLGMGLGAVFVNQLVKWDAQLQQDLDKMLEKAKEANERRYFEQDDD